MEVIPIELLYDVLYLVNKPILLSLRSCKFLLFVIKMIPLQFHKFYDSIFNDSDTVSKKYLLRRYCISQKSIIKNTYTHHAIDTRDHYFHEVLPRGIFCLTLTNTNKFGYKSFEELSKINLIALKITTVGDKIQDFPPSIQYLHVKLFTFRTSKHNFPPHLKYLRCESASPNGNDLKNLAKLEILHVSHYSSFAGYINYPKSLRYFTIDVLSSKLEKLPDWLTHLTITTAHQPKYLTLPNIPQSLFFLSIDKVIVKQQVLNIKHLKLTSYLSVTTIPHSIVKLEIWNDSFRDFSSLLKLKTLIISTLRLNEMTLPNLVRLYVYSVMPGHPITINHLPTSLKYLILDTPQNIIFSGQQIYLKYLKLKCNNIDPTFFIQSSLQHLSIHSGTMFKIPLTIKSLSFCEYISADELIKNVRHLNQLRKLILPVNMSLTDVKLPKSLRYIKTNKHNLHLIPRWVTEVVVY